MRISRVDLLVAAALTVAGALEVLLGPDHGGDRLVSALLVPLTTVPLVWRRRAPLVPLAAISVALLVQGPLDGFLVGHAITPVAALVLALYSAGRHVCGAHALAGAAAAVAATAAARIVFDPAVERPADAVLTVVAVASPLLVGRWVRGQAMLQRELEAKSERLLRERAQAARHAADEERARIAADLQAAVADGLRTIVRRAGLLPGPLRAGEHATAQAQLAGIAGTARDALADVRRVLGVLRREGQAPPLAPADPLAALDAGAGGVGTGPVPDAARAALRERHEEPAAAGGPPDARPLGGTRADGVLAAAVLVAAEVELAIVDAGVPAALTAVAIALPLLWRRRRPVPAAAAVLGAVALQSLLLDLDSIPFSDIVAIVCAAYAIGAHSERRAALGALALAAAATTAHAAVFYPEGVVPALLGGVAVPWTIGRVVRGQRQLTREVREKTAQIERIRVREAVAAATAERMRVARELHDAVAHNVSVIAIQAGAADGIAERDPERAVQCAELIEAVGREALAELARLGDAASTDAPGLARVDALAGRARDAGLPVELRIDGERAALPAGVDLAAYRIVQEALANVAKHAAATRAWIVVRYEQRAVEVEIGDDGRGPDGGGTADDGGHGLVGMRERVALYGGTLELGGRAGAGFTVHARLPLGGA